MSPTASAFFTLTISLVNMFAFMWMLISGCGQLGEYFTWLQQEVKALLRCRQEGSYTPGHHPEQHHTMNGREGGMNGGAVYLPEGTGVEATMTVSVIGGNTFKFVLVYNLLAMVMFHNMSVLSRWMCIKDTYCTHVRHKHIHSCMH